MELLSTEFSPFARKCRALIIETGLQDRVAIVNLTTSPVAQNVRLSACNPLGKVPALILADAAALYDSRVIAEYLDGLHAAERMFPQSPNARWRALRLQAVGDGVSDAAVLMRYETTLRSAAEQSRAFYDGQLSRVLRSLDMLEREASDLGGAPTIGTISVACALGYLDARFPAALDWRSGRGALSEWFAEFAARPSMRETAPVS